MSLQAPARGMLIVSMQPPAPMEEEFHAWYDTEHIPEREAVPGFLNALRFVCVDGWPQYMACYDLASLDVLAGDAYRKIGGENLSIWSRRVISRALGYDRLELRLLAGPEEVVAPLNGKVMLRLASGDSERVSQVADALTVSAPEVTARVYGNVLSEPQLVIMLDAPALELIPDWSLGELRDALGGLATDLIGGWRYRRYIRWP